jgi:hypothetical protein
MPNDPDDRTDLGGAPGRSRAPELGAHVFAGMLMILVGTFHTLQGLVAVVDDDFYLARAASLLEIDVVVWGWFHIAVGVAAGITGGAVIAGTLWAQLVAIWLAGLSMVSSFLWLPHYPLWSVLVLAFDAFVVWAVTTHIAATSPVVDH